MIKKWRKIIEKNMGIILKYRHKIIQLINIAI